RSGPSDALPCPVRRGPDGGRPAGGGDGCHDGAPMTLAINGRFLRAQPSGMHRAARALIDAARDAGLQIEVLAPPGVDDPRVDRIVPGPRGRSGDHLWEQVALPLAAGTRPLLSLTNTAPVLGRHNVV